MSRGARPRAGHASAPNAARATGRPLALVLAGAFVVVVPLALDPWGFQQRLPVAWLVVLALVPLGLAAAVRAAGGVWWSPTQRWWIALLAVFALAAATGVAPLTSIIGSPARRLGLVGWFAIALAFWWGIHLRRIEGAVDAVARALVVGSVPVSVIGIVERGERFFAFGSGPALVRSASTLRNAAFLGAYLALVIPLAAAVALDRTLSRAWRAAAGTACGLGVVTLVFSQTRAAWIGTLVALVVVARWRFPAGSANRRRTVVAAATVVAAIALLAAPVRDRALSVTSVRGGSNEARVLLWELGARAALDRPVLGYGPDATLLAYPHVVSRRFERDVTRETLPDRAHTLVLDLALWGGVPAIVAGLGLLAAVARRVRGTLTSATTAGIAAGLVAYVVQLLFSFSLADLDALVWLLAGLLVGASATRVRLPDGFARGVTAGAVLLGAGLGAWQLRDVVADRQLRAAVDADARGDIAAAERSFVAATETASERAQYWQALGRFERFVAEATKDRARFDRSVRAHRRALELVPGDTSYQLDLADTQLSQAEAGQADYPAAEATVRNVIAHDPHSARAWFVLGTVLADEGRLDDAERGWTTAADLAPTFSGPARNLARLGERRGDVVAARRWYVLVLSIEGTDAEASAYLDAHPG